MRKFLLASACAALAGCAVGATPAPTAPGTPVTTAPAAPAFDLSKVNYYLQSVGCLGAELAAAAGPVVQITSDAKGNSTLSALGQSGANLCVMTVPTAAVAQSKTPTS